MSPLLFAQKLYSRLHRRVWSAPLAIVPSPLHAASPRAKELAAEIGRYEKTSGFAHAAGSLPLRTLLLIERSLSADGDIVSAETGCGKSTIFFSRMSKSHKVFCLDDRDLGSAHSSVDYFMNCPATRMESVEIIFGPTQATLPRYMDHIPYDLVMIDGPHGYPFPELEYYFFYPHLKPGALLVIDDIHIPTIGRLADFLSEDSMFEKVAFIGSTALFRRTDAPTFDPFGDGWWLQNYNRRRAPFEKKHYLNDGKKLPPINFEGRY
ncbi:MAG TPA: class I SAM-dependent methyltransferase [Methylocystis sp.]|nr:class I SAM-dependent methyltransferase [Methylocystis sp.]